MLSLDPSVTVDVKGVIHLGQLYTQGMNGKSSSIVVFVS